MTTRTSSVRPPWIRISASCIKRISAARWFTSNGRVILCSLSNRLRKQLIYAQSDGGSGHRSVRQVKELAHNDPIAVGDQVRFIRTDDGAGMIVEVLPRRSQMTRRSAVPMPGAHPFEQVIVANLDQVVPVFAAAQPAPKWGLLDRYLVSAEASGLPALICITKLDLVTGRDRRDRRRLARCGANLPPHWLSGGAHQRRHRRRSG